MDLLTHQKKVRYFEISEIEAIVFIFIYSSAFISFLLFGYSLWDSVFATIIGQLIVLVPYLVGKFGLMHFLNLKGSKRLSTSLIIYSPFIGLLIMVILANTSSSVVKDSEVFTVTDVGNYFQSHRFHNNRRIREETIEIAVSDGVRTYVLPERMYSEELVVGTRLHLYFKELLFVLRKVHGIEIIPKTPEELKREAEINELINKLKRIRSGSS